MEVGVFQGASIGPQPWDEREPARLRNDIEIGIAADRAGFDAFWAPEHHALEEYSHSSSSHLSCLAVGVQTQRIRVITGIMNLCPPINHPVRVAEQIALIDVLTNGRVELGTGRGSGSTEVETFGVSPEDTRAMWEEALRAIPQMWTQDLFEWKGRFFRVPERCILPKPVQKPHPPLWVTASNPGTLETAGRFGIGAAMFNFADPEKSRPLVETYKNAVAKAEPVGAFVHDKLMTIAPAFCLEDGDEARALYAEYETFGQPHFATYFDTIPANAERLAGEKHPIPQSRLRELIRERREAPVEDSVVARGSVDPQFLHENGICVGSPREVIATMQRFARVGFDQLVVVPAIGWYMPHERVLESIRVMGEKVLPAVQSA
ncbi:MAG TPA: LLM class flavin-dependent oxidoreductase [Myxococcota bacterium]|nr:LLM class flavin-dependent oxidoreductase [Myxococcota bacterium]